MNTLTIPLAFVILFCSAIVLRGIAYFLQLWSYKQIHKQFYDGKPKAWYPPIERPTFFKHKNKKHVR